MLNEFSEEQIVRMLARGSEDAFERIFRSYYRPLTVFANKYVDNLEEAKEITQEFFIRLWSKQPALAPGALKAYLYRGVRNACLNYLEKNKVAAKHMKDYVEREYTNDNALHSLMLAEQEEEYMRAIDNLPTRCRQVFVMSRTQKLSYRAIAEELGISVKTVENQMTIALRRLRELLLCLVGLLILIFC